MNPDSLDATEIGAEAVASKLWVLWSGNGERFLDTLGDEERRAVLANAVELIDEYQDALFSIASSDSIALIRDGDKVKVMRLKHVTRHQVSWFIGIEPLYRLVPLAQQEER